jgi:hypothetical protein
LFSQVSSFKGFTRSISGSNLFSYFSSSITPKVSPSTSPPNPYPHSSSTSPEPHGSSSLLSPSTKMFIPGPSNFLLGPTNLHGPDEDIHPVIVYLSKNSSSIKKPEYNEDEDDIDEYYLVAYKVRVRYFVFVIINF